MGQGRKPLPTEVKRTKGTLQKCRTLENEMNPDKVEDMPQPPEYLDELGKKEWFDIIPELKKTGVLARLDLSIIAMYCNEIATYIDCQQQMRKAGTRVMVIKGEDNKVKYAQQVPYQKIANDAMAKALSIATEFGFTPAARTRIGAPKQQGTSRILELINGGKTKTA